MGWGDECKSEPCVRTDLHDVRRTSIRRISLAMLQCHVRYHVMYYRYIDRVAY